MLSKKEVGKNVKRARGFKSKTIGRKYTQKMLAVDANTSQGYISDIESGRTYPSDRVAQGISNACGVPLDFIFGSEDRTVLDDDFSKVQKASSEEIKSQVSYLSVLEYRDDFARIPPPDPRSVFIPQTIDYPYETHFAVSIKDNSLDEIGISKNDLVIIRKQSTVEDDQIVALRVADDGGTEGFILRKFSQLNETITLKPKGIRFWFNISIVGVAVAITKKLA